MKSRHIQLALCGLLLSCGKCTDANDDADRELRREARGVALASHRQEQQPKGAPTDCVHDEAPLQAGERDTLRAELRTHLRADLRAFFLEVRRRRDPVARMLTTNGDAARLTAWNMANEIVGFPNRPDCGGRADLRATLQHAFVDALADALDDDVDATSWQSNERFDRLDVISDPMLREASRTSSLPSDQYRAWLDQMLFYVGKMSHDELRTE
jgi:hypothetical protein